MWGKFKTQNDIDFIDKSRVLYQRWPVQLASEVPTLAREHQKEKHGKYLFPHCPGMIDYAQMGYIVPAWTDIKIKANKAGVVVGIGSGQKRRDFQPPQRMEEKIVEGFFTPQDGVPFIAHKLTSPWHIITDNNISAILVAPTYHTTWGDDLHIWPGIVDYKNLADTHVIFSAKRECEVVIKTGEPLLHVLPFYNKKISAGFGAATPEQVDRIDSTIYKDDSQFYRKFLAVKKFFSLNREDNSNE